MTTTTRLPRQRGERPTAFALRLFTAWRADGAPSIVDATTAATLASLQGVTLRRPTTGQRSLASVALAVANATPPAARRGTR